MALNIPPAAGVKPHEAAQKLRILIKQLMAVTSSPSQVTGLQYSEGERSQIALNRKNERVNMTDNKFAELNKFLDDLTELAKLRKPSLIRQKVADAKAGGIIYALGRYLREERVNVLERERQVVRRANSLMASGAAPATPASTKLAEIYALIQVLPTTLNATDDSKDARSLRAITAIVKAHHGQIEGELAKVGQPELPIILLQTKETIVEKFVEVAPPETVDVPEVAPYYIVGAAVWTTAKIMKHPSGENAHHALQVGSVSSWSQGYCTLEAAIETLWACRGKTNTPTVVLQKNGKLVASIGRGKPIEFAWMNIPLFKIRSGATPGSPMGNPEIMESGGISTANFGAPGTSGDISVWNGGRCLLPDALKALQAVRCWYSDEEFQLVREEIVYAVVHRHQPIAVVYGETHAGSVTVAPPVPF